MTRFYDVSMPVYKDKPEKQPAFECTANHADHHMQETRVHMDVHTGTHLDAPLHMVDGGVTIEQLPLEQLIRDCRVIDLTHVTDRIHADDLKPHHPQAGEFLLLKTTNSSDTRFNPAFVFLAEDGASYLADIGIAGVGIDALGVERSQPGHVTHKALFGREIIILEGLRLADVPAGTYQMIALPIALQDVDAAPARVVLVKP